MWVRIAARYPIWYEPAILAAFRIHSASATAAFATSGTDFADKLKCIETYRAWLPADRAERLTRAAKEYSCLVSIPQNCPDDVALSRVEQLLDITRPGPNCRSAVSNAYLRAARIHYRHGRHFQALAFLGRSVLMRPVVVGRPLKRLVQRGSAMLFASESAPH
jgi:hypothetical protein